MSTKEQRDRMEQIVARFQEYVRTYTEQQYYLEYSDTIFMDDMLYGIGLALDPDGHRCADGWDKAKAMLLAHLNKH
jgi:hypothetical protein